MIIADKLRPKTRQNSVVDGKSAFLKDSSRLKNLGRRAKLLIPVVPAVIGLVAAGCSSNGTVSASNSETSSSAASSATPSADQSPVASGGICSLSEPRHTVTVESGISGDVSTKSGVVVSFLVDNYQDKAFPGRSLQMLVDFTKPWQKYTRVASTEISGGNGPGGLIDVTQLSPDLDESHPVTGIKPGDIYSVLVADGNSATGNMNAREYSITVRNKDAIKVIFDGCATLGQNLPSYRENTPQP